MKINSGMPLFSHGKIFKPWFVSKLPLLKKFSGLKNGAGVPSISFTNPLRDSNTNNGGTKSPIQIKLSAKTCPSQGRFYTGDFPSVTTILDATRPKSNLFALLNWRRKQITDLGKAGFDEKVANTKHNGTTFHEAVKSYLTNGHQPKLAESNQGHWKSVSHVLSNIDEVIALESVVVHPVLGYAGKFDGLVMYKGKLCLIDWKTSEKKRNNLKDCFSYPHQIVAYAGAVNYDPNYAPVKVSNGLLVLAYSDGSQADTIWMSSETCQQYWDEWIERLQLYHNIEDTNQSTTSGNSEGRPLNNLAQSVDGLPVKKPPKGTNTGTTITEPTVNKLDYNVLCTDTSELYESSIDVFGIDPSLVEFSEETE